MTDVAEESTTVVIPGSTGTWRWWSDVVIRSAGFPAAGVRSLAVAQSVTAFADSPSGDDERTDEDLRAFELHFARTMHELSERIGAVAARSDFQTAVGWQNHRSLETAIEPLLRWDGGARNSKHRQHEELVTAYWQRYCVKNDSIGSFGPVGWGRLDPAVPTRTRPGRRLVAARNIFFEPWVLDQLAAALSPEEELRPWLCPRRMPYIRIEDGRVLTPGGRALPLSATETVVLGLCDGTLEPRRIADRASVLLKRGAGEELSEREVTTILEALVKQRCVSWKLELPVGPRPEHALRRLLEKVEDGAVRVRCVAALDELERGRDRVAASDEPGHLRTALEALDKTFTRLTGAAPTRHEGRTYGGRTLVYFDSRRDIECVIGREVLQAAAPLELVLSSARWLGYELAQQVRARLLDVHREIAGPGGTVDLATYWFSCLQSLVAATREEAARLQSVLARRWDAILRIPVDERSVEYSAGVLQEAIDSAFAVPGPGWSAARYCSPDVLIDASGVDSINRGEFRLVLGELHVAVNTQRHYCFVTQHPDKRRLEHLLDQDFPEPRLLPVLPKESPPRLSIRTHSALVRERDFMIACAHQTVAADRPRVVASADASVIEQDGQLYVQLRGGELFDLLDVFSEILMESVVEQFRLADHRPHTPRLSIDRLVIARETWIVPANEVEFVHEKTEARRFVGARAWRRQHDFPPHVFVTTSQREKPFFVDFDNPLSINVLVRAVRRSAGSAGGGGSVKVAEMLPTFDGLWFADRGGNRYTAELRLVAFDLLSPASGDVRRA